MATTGGIIVEKMYGGIALDWNHYDALGRIEHSGPNWTNTGGGYLTMTNGTLQNNRYGVYMAPYALGNVNTPSLNNTSFTGTTFIQNAHLPDITFVDAQGNRIGTDRFFHAVQCNKVTFKNTRFKGFPTLLRQYRGQGIKANDTEIDCFTDVGTPAFNFEDLAMGAFGVHSVLRMDIRSCRFNNCDLGIHQIGGDGGSFTGNTLNIPVGVSSTQYTCGIRANGNSNVLIANNTLTGMGTGAFNDNNRGVYVLDAGTAASLTGYNTCNKLTIGLQTAGINGANGTNTLGHALQCNTLQAANYYDLGINVQGTGVVAQQGQGCLTSPLQTQSGNKFLDQSACTAPTRKNILSGKLTLNSGTTPPWTYYGSVITFEDPACISINVTEFTCNPGNAANCSSSNLVCTTAACNTANVTAMNAETDVQKKELLRNRIIDYYYRVNDVNSAITNLNAWNTASSKRRLVGAYLRLRQWANAQTALNAVGIVGAENAAFTSVYQVLIDIGVSGGTLASYTPAQKSAFQSVANGTTTMRHTAQAVLNSAEGTPITLIWEEPEAANGSSVVKSMEAEQATYGQITAMPNPFGTSTTIICVLPEGTLDVRVMVTDLQGRIVEDERVAGGTQLAHNVSGEGKPDGVYLCTVIADGVVLGVARIAVQH